MAPPTDTTVDPEEEARLVRSVLRRDELAFRQLYRLHARRLHVLALRLTGGSEADALDVQQEAWHRAVKGLAGFEGRSSLATWLSAIVVRCAHERRRSEARFHRPAPTDEGVRNGRIGVVDRIELERAFQKLPPGFRTVLVLHDLEGYRHEDIAERLGISPGTSKSQLSRARARMRELLEEHHGND